MLKKVIIAGASGLIGSSLLNLLLESDKIAEVLVLVRKPLSLSHPKLTQIQTPFTNLFELKDQLYGDAVYCCLGTTKQKTPDLNEYRKIDHDHPIELAKIASENGVAQYHLVSALGADQYSSIFYNRIKGETENDLKKFPFTSIHIYQPSLLIGNRKEQRVFEKLAIYIMKAVNPLLIGGLKKYRSIKAEVIASAMHNQTIKELEGIHIYPSDEIKKLA